MPQGTIHWHCFRFQISEKNILGEKSFIMKKLLSLSAFIFLLGISAEVNAQSTAEEVGKDIKQGAKKAGNKTAEVASKGKAKVTDQTHKDKVGPNGETIYIDNHTQYYWVDKKGKRHYVAGDSLKPKTND
jgi:hypothetical protein